MSKQEIKAGDAVVFRNVGAPLEGKVGEVAEVLPNGTCHVKVAVIEVHGSSMKTTIRSLDVSSENLEYDESATAFLRARSESGRRETLGQRAVYGKFKMTTDSHTFPAGLPYRLVKDRLGYGDDYRQQVLIPSIESWWKTHRYATTEEFASEVREHDDGYWESGDFLQVPHISDEDKALVFKWRFLGDTVLLELHDVIFG